MASTNPTTDNGAMPSLEAPNMAPPHDAIMADAPPINNMAAQPHRTSTPQRNGAAATSTMPAAAPAPPAEAAIPTKAAPHGARCRQYLNEKVTPVLLAGVKRVAAEQPEDPLRMLGEFLIAKSHELEGQNTMDRLG